tara:strand:+ start:76 stop:573 length:498 start_codon:yes stop_codon:yes gene_type:complete
MLVKCKSCQKKFLVPDSAITESGRLLQCGSCGNKWSQYPIKEKSVKEIEKITSVKIKKPNNINKIKSSVKKKKREINLYSTEYLKKKHGLEIKDSLRGQSKKQNKSNFGFYSYLITTSIFIIALFGVLNISKDTIIVNYPVAGPYIDYLYEVINIIRITISEFIN